MMTAQDHPPSARAAKRIVLAKSLADIALRDGIDALSLRPAAARLGTSDRMLLYYFGTKAEMIVQTLAVVSARLAAKLDCIPESPRRLPFAVIETAVCLLADPEIRPFMAVWSEIVARAVRGDATYEDVARRTATGWTDWITKRTAFPTDVDPKADAAAMLALIEGLSTSSLLTAADTDARGQMAVIRACVGWTDDGS